MGFKIEEHRGLFDYINNTSQSISIKDRSPRERSFVVWCGEDLANQLNEFYKKNIKKF